MKEAEGLPEIDLLRATALSYLVTMYIKHYSGLLSSLCGCAGAAVDRKHGIIGASPEQTMRNIGYIADPGMVMTEQAIVDILRQKEA